MDVGKKTRILLNHNDMHRIVTDSRMLEVDLKMEIKRVK